MHIIGNGIAVIDRYSCNDGEGEYYKNIPSSLRRSFRTGLNSFIIRYVYKLLLHMGVSMGNHQVHTATTSKSFETFRICREFCVDHFGKKKFSRLNLFS